MRMGQRIALQKCERRSPILAASMDSHFSRWSAGLTTIRFLFRGSLRQGCFLFPAGTVTAIGLMNTPRRKIFGAGRWYWQSRWQSCVAVLSDQLSVFRKSRKPISPFVRESSFRRNEWRPEEKRRPFDYAQGELALRGSEGTAALPGGEILRRDAPQDRNSFRIRG